MPLTKKEIDRRYREKNREKILETKRKWYKKNKEKIKEVRKIYKKSEKGKKSNRICKWKFYGIIDEDLSAVYDFLIEQTHCMICYKEYKDSSDRHLDHDHQTGEIRYICCRYCNVHLLR